MIIYHSKTGERRIHIEDADNYVPTDDNGVDFFPTKEQVAHMVKVFTKKGGER